MLGHKLSPGVRIDIGEAAALASGCALTVLRASTDRLRLDPRLVA
jgi:hypothetical protein